jgi:hypothetical protein
VEGVVSFWNDFQSLLSNDWNEERSFIRLLFLPVIFSGFGAYFGAKAAAWQRDREQTYATVKDSLHQLSDLSVMTGTLCNLILTLKKQQVRDIANNYAIDRTRVSNHFGIPTLNKERLSIRFDLQTISPPPLEASVIVSNISRLKDRGASDYMQAAAIHQSCENIIQLIERRNEWIADFKSRQTQLDEWERVALYFGFPLNFNSVDLEYRGLVEGLANATDDAIFHSYQLYGRLTTKLVHSAVRFEKKYQERFKFSFLNFEPSRDFLPDVDGYATWLKEASQIPRRRLFGLEKWKQDVLKQIG